MLSYLDLVLDVECFVINVSCLYLLLRPRNIPNVRSFLISLSFYIFFVTHFKSTKLHFSKNDVLDKSNLGFHCAKCSNVHEQENLTNFGGRKLCGQCFRSLQFHLFKLTLHTISALIMKGKN